MFYDSSGILGEYVLVYFPLLFHFFSKLVVWLHFLPGNFMCFVPCTPCGGITAVP